MQNYLGMEVLAAICIALYTPFAMFRNIGSFAFVYSIGNFLMLSSIVIVSVFCIKDIY